MICTVRLIMEYNAIKIGLQKYYIFLNCANILHKKYTFFMQYSIFIAQKTPASFCEVGVD